MNGQDCTHHVIKHVIYFSTVESNTTMPSIIMYTSFLFTSCSPLCLLVEVELVRLSSALDLTGVCFLQITLNDIVSILPHSS